MQVITVSSDLNNFGFINYLKSSCAFYGLDLLILEYDDVFFSNRLKDALLNQYILDIPDDNIIFFTDANDTAFLSNEKEILEKFGRFNSPLVFSAEINCWPDSSLKIVYPPTEAHFKYLNSGGFIGRAGFLKYLYRKYPIFTTVAEKYDWSNQHYWNHIFVNEHQSITLDYYCSIFFNTALPLNQNNFNHDLQSPGKLELILKTEKSRLDCELVFVENKVKSIITNSMPSHLHFPGPISKILMEDGYFKNHG